VVALSFLIFTQVCYPMDNISLEKAQEIAQRQLDRMTPQHRFTLIPGDVREFVFGWVFGFAPKKYIESHDINDLVPGPNSLVVEPDGTTSFLPSSPRDHAIAEFARESQSRHR